MALFYFVLKTRWDEVFDEEGVDLLDAQAAREHAITVARELVRNTDVMQRSSRIVVCDDYLMPLFEIGFSEVDPTIDHLDPRYRDTIVQVARSTALLHEALLQTRSSLAQVKKTFEEVERLIAYAGQRTLQRGTAGQDNTGGRT